MADKKNRLMSGIVIGVISVVVLLFIAGVSGWILFNKEEIVEDVETYCYQETYTTATDCGGKSSGSYVNSAEFLTEVHGSGQPVASYLTIKAEKPENSIYGTIWQVKHGNNIPTYNITISKECWDADKYNLNLRLVSSNPDGYGKTKCSYGQCLTDLGWKTVTEELCQIETPIYPAGGYSRQSSLTDGDYDTATWAINNGQIIGGNPMVFWTSASGDIFTEEDIGGKWYEESLYWGIAK